MDSNDSRQEIITEDGEVTRTGGIALIEDATALAMTRAEIDVQIATARRYPRSVRRVISNTTTLATLDEETATECLYALVRGQKRKGSNVPDNDRENKPIEGPSIRLAEIAAQCYGNCRIDARVICVNRAEKYVEAEGVFHDLETNMASRATVRRRISTAKGFLFSEDMIVVTGNAACSIAKRNAILAGIPRGVYRPAYQAARSIVAGTTETLGKNREKAIRAFATFGVTPDQIFGALGVEGEADIKVDHIATLRAMFATLKNGEATVEEMFSTRAADFQKVANPLADAPAVEAAAGPASSAADSGEVAVGASPQPEPQAPPPAPQAEAPAPDAPAAEDRAAALDAARLRGTDAAQKGKLREKSLPTAYRDDAELSAAYFGAFDEARTIAAQGSEGEQ